MERILSVRYIFAYGKDELRALHVVKGIPNSGQY